jgi:hypothetical protein
MLAHRVLAQGSMEGWTRTLTTRMLVVDRPDRRAEGMLLLLRQQDLMQQWLRPLHGYWWLIMSHMYQGVLLSLWAGSILLFIYTFIYVHV